MKYDLKLKIGNNEFNFGKGIIMLMEKTNKYSSLSAAYKEMGMSSSKAWKIIKNAEKDLGFPLFESKSGGAQGGSTVLTKEGRDLYNRYVSMMTNIESYVYEQFQLYFDDEKGVRE